MNELPSRPETRAVVTVPTEELRVWVAGAVAERARSGAGAHSDDVVDDAAGVGLNVVLGSSDRSKDAGGVIEDVELSQEAPGTVVLRPGARPGHHRARQCRAGVRPGAR